MNLPTQLGIGSALFVAGILLGHWTAPPTVLKIADKSSAVESTTSRSDTKHDVAVQTAVRVGPTVTRWRIVYRDPKCGVIEQTKEVDMTAGEMRVDAQNHETKVATVDRMVEKIVEHTSVIERREDWLLSARTGTDLMLSRPSIGGAIERRLFGRFYAGIWADSRGLAGLGITLAF